MLDDGNVIIIDSEQHILWKTNTGLLRYGKLNIFFETILPRSGADAIKKMYS